MVLNAFLEEVVCMGYIFNQLAARVRARSGGVDRHRADPHAACHTYQDPVHLAGIGTSSSPSTGSFIGGCGGLWPLILAHLVLDIVSLSVLKLYFS